MIRVLIATSAGTSHVGKVAPVASELVRRGAEVAWYAGERYRDAVLATGARYLPGSGEALPEMDAIEERHPELVGMPEHKRGSWWLEHVMVGPAGAQYTELSKALRDFPADVVLADSTVLGAGLLHEMEQPLWATLSVAPMAIPDPDVPPYGPGWQPGSGPLYRLRNALASRIGERLMMRAPLRRMNAIRAELGLAPVRSPFAANATPYLYLQASTPSFEYPRRELPEQVRFVGPLLPDPPADFVPPTWWSELDGRRAVLVSQGTVATSTGGLVEPAVRALAGSDLLVVVTGRGTAHLGALGGNVRTAEYLPHDALMPKMAAVVTTGGYGTVQLALRHGIPLVTAGATEDKPEVCARVAWSGAGVFLRGGHPSPQRIAAAVRQVLDDPSYRERARALAGDFARHDAPAEIARLLAELVAEHRHSSPAAG
ncbi:glycosyltransferase [Micromonospora sp. CPCC 205371]|nr:glycosyltransferase [Micromonospora sp. CPCC 205371]